MHCFPFLVMYLLFEICYLHSQSFGLKPFPKVMSEKQEALGKNKQANNGIN